MAFLTCSIDTHQSGLCSSIVSMIGFAEFACCTADEDDVCGLLFLIGGCAKVAEESFAEEERTGEIDVECIALQDLLAR